MAAVARGPWPGALAALPCDAPDANGDEAAAAAAAAECGALRDCFSSCSTSVGADLARLADLGSPVATPSNDAPSSCASASPLAAIAADDDGDSGAASAVWSSPGDTVIIFDWDDTLCPTTAIRDGASLDPTALELHVRAAELALRVAAGLGRVVVVTMANGDWIEETTAKYMPSVGAVLRELGVPIELARVGVPPRHKRRAFCEDGRDPSHYMKRRSMKKVLRDLYGSATRGHTRPRSWTNVLSLGDSDAERLALQDLVLWRTQRDVAGRWAECRCKTVKLKEKPSLEELTAQLRDVAEGLEGFVEHDGDLDLEFFDDEVAAAVEELQHDFGR